MLATTINITLSGDWVSAVMNTLMFLVTAVSAWYAYRAYQHQRDRSKKAAACELAKYYADEIVEKYSLVAGVLEQSKLDTYIKGALCFDELCDFDMAEIRKLVKKSGTDPVEFFSKIHTIDPFIILNVQMTSVCAPQDRSSTFSDYVEYDAETGERKLKNSVFLINDFFQEVSHLLNQLEWFAMSCRYGVADETLLYQSLHQTFLATVWVLYPYISLNNVRNEDKLYTNLIWLFDAWRTRLTDIKTKAETKREALQKQVDAIKPEIYTGKGV